MRNYSITVSNPKTGAVAQEWSALNNPNALNVEMDFFAFNARENTGQSTLTIEGISLSDLLQSPKYYGMNVTIKGGFQAGLPLANPAQFGTIWQGPINQSFGNWIGVEQTLDFVMFAGAINTFRKPAQFVLNWKAGSSFQAAVQVMLNTAFPTLSVKFSIASNYVLSHDVLHVVNTFAQMASFVNSITRHIQQPGVEMAIRSDNSIIVFDNLNPPKPKQIAFNELIGQPTWVAQNTMQFVTPMRADIQVGDVIAMPQGIGAPGTVGTTAGSLGGGPLKYKASFQGSFVVTSIRYLGNFRDPSGSSWATIFSANANVTG